ncbi:MULTISPECIES: glycosyltransferase 87 family protein [unclassified Gordonia (in: high G+C Gram-positive bacteria)]
MTAVLPRRAFTAINIIGAVVLFLGVCRVFGQPWLVHLGPTKFWGPPVDLQIYRYGGQFLFHGQHLYDGPMPQANDSILPFTYPPFAALAFVPMSWLPVRVLSVIFLVIGCLLTFWLIRVLLRRVGCGDLPIGWTLLLTGIAYELEPVRITLDLGQINLILAGLVIADTLWDRRPAWAEPYRGLLVGIAAAIKMTPAVVIIYFIARRQWRAAINVGVGFVVATGIAWAIVPSDSLKYWTSTVFDPDRIGGLAFVYNQGIAGVLARMGMSDSQRSHWWLPLCAIAGLYCLVLAWHLAKRREYELCFLAAWAVALLATPAAWIHHWVLTSVYILVFLVVGVRALRALREPQNDEPLPDAPPTIAGVSSKTVAWVFITLGVLGLVAQLPGPSLFLPSAQLNELRWGWWENIYGNSSLIWLLLVLVISWWLPFARVREIWEGSGTREARLTSPPQMEPGPLSGSDSIR